VFPITSCETASSLRPVNLALHSPAPEVAVVKEQIALNSVASAKRPFTVTVYAVSGLRPENRKEEVHSVFGSSPEVPLT